MSTPTFATERTALAWRRTALGLLGGSVAAGRLLVEPWGVGAWAVTAAGAALAFVLLRTARRRLVGRRHHPPPADVGGILAGGRLVTVCAAAMTLLGGAGFAVVLTWR